MIVSSITPIFLLHLLLYPLASPGEDRGVSIEIQPACSDSQNPSVVHVRGDIPLEVRITALNSRELNAPQLLVRQRIGSMLGPPLIESSTHRVYLPSPTSSTTSYSFSLTIPPFRAAQDLTLQVSQKTHDAREVIGTRFLRAYPPRIFKELADWSQRNLILVRDTRGTGLENFLKRNEVKFVRTNTSSHAAALTLVTATYDQVPALKAELGRSGGSMAALLDSARTLPKLVSEEIGTGKLVQIQYELSSLLERCPNADQDLLDSILLSQIQPKSVSNLMR